MASELFKMMSGVSMVHVPYRGSAPMLNDLIRRASAVRLRRDIFVPRPHQVRPAARAGVSTATRLEVLPDVPPVDDFVPGYEAVGWQASARPKTTPAEIIDLINREMALWPRRSQAEGQACGPRQRRAVALARRVRQGDRADTEKWGKVVKFAGLRPE